jgi:hypothetical protein
MVDSVAATLDAVIANGGEVIQPIGADAPELTAWVRDPAGNVIGSTRSPQSPLPTGRSLLTEYTSQNAFRRAA